MIDTASRLLLRRCIRATTLLGWDVIEAPDGPSQITLVDPAEILYSEDRDQTELAISRQATVLIDDGASPATTTKLSLFQTHCVAYRVAVFVSWVRVRAGAVAYMATAY